MQTYKRFGEIENTEIECWFWIQARHIFETKEEFDNGDNLVEDAINRFITKFVLTSFADLYNYLHNRYEFTWKPIQEEKYLKMGFEAFCNDAIRAFAWMNINHYLEKIINIKGAK